VSGLDKYFGGYQTVQEDGVALPQRLVLNVGDGLTAIDDPVNGRTTISGSGGSAVSLASGWAQQAASTITATPSNVVSTSITPASTGLLRVSVDSGMYSSGTSSVQMGLVINVDGGRNLYTGLAIAPPSTIASGDLSFTVDLDRLDSPYVATPGAPITINVVGATFGGPTDVLTTQTTLAIQERQQ
jgi:hypothetical protein